MLSLYSETEIDAKMRAKSLKNFICAKKDGTILMGGIEGVTIFEMPNLLLKFDCYNALNLDTGGSTAMTFNGKYIKGPGRSIMDAFVVVKMTPEEIAGTRTVAVTVSPALPVDNTQESAQKMLRTLLSSIQTKSQGNATKKEQLLQDLKKRLTLLISRSKNKKQKAIYEAVLEKIQ